VGPEEEQEKHLSKFNYVAQQRESLVNFSLGVRIAGIEVEDFTKVADNGYVGVL